MARPLELIEKLEGEDAMRFLDEMERIESLKPGDPEYEKREKFFEKCIKAAEQAGAI